MFINIYKYIQTVFYAFVHFDRFIIIFKGTNVFKKERINFLFNFIVPVISSCLVVSEKIESQS